MQFLGKWRHSHRILWEWLILCFFLLALGGYLAYSLNENRLSIEARERDRLTQQCKVVGMNLGRQFASINMALTGILSEMPGWRKQKNGQALATRHLKALSDAMPSVMTFLIFDANGTVAASDKPGLVGKNFAQRDYFQAVLHSPSPTTLYVRPPFLSALGNFTMNLARMVPGPEGQFNGLVVAALDAEEFKVLLNSVLYRTDIRASLIHGDGVPFLTAPNSRNVDALDLVKPGSFLEQHMKSGRQMNVFTGTAYFIGDERMIALQTIMPEALSMDRPMVIAIDRRLQSLYANWDRNLLKNGQWFALLTLLSVIGLILHQRRRRLLEYVETRYEVGRQNAVEALRQSEERFRSLTKLSSDWYWEQDDQFRFVRLPGDLDQRTRIANDGHVGKTRWEMGAVNLTEADWERHRTELQSHQEFHDFEMLRVNNAGISQWTSISGTPIFDALGNFKGYYGVARDITEHKLAEENIKRLAFYDSLTQLPNRRLLKDRLTLAFATSKRSQNYGAVMFLDMDNFKPLNDKHGHTIGDLLLIEVAARLKRCVRDTDTVARLGGDEFVVIANHLGLALDESCVQAGRIAEKIRASLAQPYALIVQREGKADTCIEHRCTVSVGVTMFLNLVTSEDEVLKWADQAMYDAKASGCNTIRFYKSKADEITMGTLLDGR